MCFEKLQNSHYNYFFFSLSLFKTLERKTQKLRSDIYIFSGLILKEVRFFFSLSHVIIIVLFCIVTFVSILSLCDFKFNELANCERNVRVMTLHEHVLVIFNVYQNQFTQHIQLFEYKNKSVNLL